MESTAAFWLVLVLMGLVWLSGLALYAVSEWRRWRELGFFLTVYTAYLESAAELHDLLDANRQPHDVAGSRPYDPGEDGDDDG